VEQIIGERLGTLVFGVGDEDLHEVVVHLLTAKQKTIATAESITGGLIAHRLSQVPGASNCLKGGLVSYDTTWKIQHLGVDPQLIQEHGVVSKQVAEAMAVGCRERYGVDFAVSSTGIAGPTTGGEDKPLGTVWVAFAWEGGVTSHTFCWMGTRTEVQSRTAKMALNLVRLGLSR
jgi:nicotinamide-nucleotide amidase